MLTWMQIKFIYFENMSKPIFYFEIIQLTVFGFAYVYLSVNAVTEVSNIVNMKVISKPAVGARSF